MSHDLPKAYDPTAIEDRWAEYWVHERLFDVPTPEGAPAAPVFTILLPPPNVTGRLHMGHMLNQTEMDILTRWRRMSGDLALWLPGTDHAGIATQLMVERQLASENSTRQELGREAFVERVWQWKQHYGGAILDQMKRLGASVDWSREYFTMDDNLSIAVREAFVRLHEQGLIYRGAYIVNWCPRCQTAISDLEVVHEEQQGKLWEINYPVIEEPGQYLTVATTRPETMLGDVAVAVNPDDERYKHLHGKRLRLPLVEREIPVITDAWVSADFGTGAVKVTPAHDPNDFTLGQRHGLPSVNVMDETAHINAEGGIYAGLDRYEARKRVLAALEAQGLLVAAKDHVNAIGKCDRCGTVVEPRLSTQWFIKIQPLADKAIAAVEQDYIKFTPEQYAKTYFEWMRNIHDWCISRQLWWGHRIPAWHCLTCKQITVARDTPATCSHCGGAELQQETDVLDTWFSSGLLPCSVFGWPHHTHAADVFYPTQLLVTGFDILFFWVARMIMLGCHFMLDMPMPDGSERMLKDAVPFREVYIHALVRDADRQKMSKTKGNVIDPIEIVSKYGTDAVRFTLAAMASPGTDIAFSEARTEGYRAFANKIWNAARFIFMNVDRAAEVGIVVDPYTLVNSFGPDEHDPIEARWIVSRLNNTATEVNKALEEYRFHEAANLVYQFFWGDFCDWYLEIVKLRLNFSESAGKQAIKSALTTLLSTFEAALRLLSPFMPFITEELWHAMYNGMPPAKSIALSRYPQPLEEALSAQVEADISILQDLIVTVRALRKDLDVPERQLVAIQVTASEKVQALMETNRSIIEKLARVTTIDFPAVWNLSSANTRTTANFTVGSPYEKPIDIAVERERLKKKLEQYEKMLVNAERQLGNEAFLAKAPEKVVSGLKKQASEAAMLRQETLDAIEKLEGLA
ncbi:valine--tRNA ligase [Alloacidobacterium dinghuense]|uniref:Valine--tRNA ligase n=1 Tax=Alloacidobacterium dinghuense TaxID=2763107 RepID=A0A7G8BL19_9BACT|nr:valine--tRNA ligase [Alloacidobacterium dinghuense]QNI33239.1 valine--tRNA ligase [Alloacidobacterium dinghuense]